MSCPADSIAKLDTDQKLRASNYSGGESAGKSWTEKVMNVKQSSDPPQTLVQDTLEGVDEDEWVSWSLPWRWGIPNMINSSAWPLFIYMNSFCLIVCKYGV